MAITERAIVEELDNEVVIRIPMTLAQACKLRPGAKVNLKAVDGRLLVCRAVTPRRYRLSELLAQCGSRRRGREAITGRSGREQF